MLLDACDDARGRGARVAAVAASSRATKTSCAPRCPSSTWSRRSTCSRCSICSPDWDPATVGPVRGSASRATAPAAPRLPQDLGRLRPALRLLRHPAHQGHLRDARAADRPRRGAPAIARGARELVLVGQDTTRWRTPGYGGLERLLADLRDARPALAAAHVPAARRLDRRPAPGPGGLRRAVRRHAAAARLAARARGHGARAATARPISTCSARVRARVPGAAVRSTFIAGFPGETDDDVEELLEFVRRPSWRSPACSPSTPRRARAAATLPGQVPTRLARGARRARGRRRRRGRAAVLGSFVGPYRLVLVERGSRGVSRGDW